MFRSLSFVGVASAAIIESRPHEHLQMANAQLQNATEAVIKTAAVAGLAYAGAYMAAAGTTPGAYDSSRRSQASSTGQRYCDTRETDPTKYKCTAEYFNGNKVDNADVAQSKVAIRNYWCCPASDLGGKYIGDLNGVCVDHNNGASVFAAGGQGAGGCVYQGPCRGSTSGIVSIGGTAVGQTGGVAASGLCDSPGNDGQPANMGAGIFGGVPGGYFGGLTKTAGSPAVPTFPGGEYLGAMSGLAYANGVAQPLCCVKTDQGKDGATTYDLTPATLNQPISFCTLAGYTNADYTCA